MFDSNQNRYVSKGIHEAILLEIQLFCWTCLDKKRLSKTIEVVYLQIFEVKKSNNSHQTKIVHRQEKPYFCDNYQIRLKNQL